MSALSRGEWQERMETGCVGGGFSPGRPFQSERVWTAVGPHPETSAVLTWCLASTHTRTQLCWEDLRAPRTPTVPSQSQGSRPSPREQDKRARQTGEPTGRGAGGGGACGSSEARPREVGGTREQMASAEAWRRPATTVGTGLGWHSGPETRSTCNENVFTSETYLKSVHEI